MTDAGLAFVAKLGNPTLLDLEGNLVTDEGLGQLQKLHELKDLTLPKDRFSASALSDLRAALPNCTVNFR